jgi:predicted Zn-dependent protease
MTKKLTDDPISEEDISALKTLVNCQKNENCTLPATDMLNAFLGALSHEPVNSRLLADYSDYVSDELHDYKLSESLLREAISKTPQQTGMRIALADVLLKEGNKSAASEQVEILEHSMLDEFENRQLAKLKKALE